ncbi:AAA family ATPase [Kineococcus rubinsiae]|uniref:AAA family ATPase n=1 Tax=Kineococcus rubinsiae TaxID=2609562 RepID=UPI001431E061|nr:AAA family ATPase [Kineococcus rubinsiae]NIZ91741.1 AAA family ATPase [Kineococcus rubinsiae]
MTTAPVTAAPEADVALGNDGKAEVTIADTTHYVSGNDIDDARQRVLALLAAQAAELRRPLRTRTHGDEGEWTFIVHPDGTLAPDDTAAAPTASESVAAPVVEPVPEPLVAPVPEPVAEPVVEPTLTPAALVVPLAPARTLTSSPEESSTTHPTAPPLERPTGWTSAATRVDTATAPTAVPVTDSRALLDQDTAETDPTPGTHQHPKQRESFLTSRQAESPATQGLRGAVSLMGLRVGPSASELAFRADRRAVSQHWPTPRTIYIANEKGGVGKTPTVVCLSAVFARYGGAGVLAWDNNQTRGTLGWRTEQGPHEVTLHELLPHVGDLLGPNAQAAHLAAYTHHQREDHYDVLRSKPVSLAVADRVTRTDVDRIHQVASKYYRLIFIDSGNDVADPIWQRGIDHTDQLVIATTTRDDHAEAGARLLEALTDRDEHSARLAREAVVVVNTADARATREDKNRMVTAFGHLAREAVVIPHDPGMVDGILRYDGLRPATQRAWLNAAAHVARGL